MVSHRIVALIISIVSYAVTAESVFADDLVQLITFKTHSRILIRIDETVPIDLRTSPEGFEVVLKGVGLGELGAPIGEEEQWKAQYESLKDSRISSLRFEEVSSGVKIFGQWKFPEGRLTLANPSMEIFEYRDKVPARYVVDFWLKEGPTLLEARSADHQAHFLALIRKSQQDAQKRITRKLASQKKSAEVENPKRFCEQPLNENSDVFLEFYPIHQEVDFTRWFPPSMADSKFTYRQPQTKDRESEYVRLALKLYTDGKTALAIRSVDFFDAEFHHSSFQPEMKFLRANSMIKLGLKNEGEQLLKQIMTDEKGSVVALSAAFYLTEKLIERKSPLAALENFLWLVQYYPTHSLNWVFHLGAAECLYKLRQTERATKEYRWVMDKAPTELSRAEGAFRIGDPYLLRFQYEQALASYSQAFNSFQNQMDHFPSSSVNRAESLYQLRQYERAHQSFEWFLEHHPNHPEGWRAAFRLGEIAARKSADQTQSSISRQWFYKTINQYPTSPGSTLARLRLIPCGDHGGFTLDSQERFFKEDAEKFNGNEEVFLKNYMDFEALAQTRTLITLGTPNQATDSSIVQLRVVKSPMVKRELIVIANHFFQKIISELLSNGKKYEALTYYQEKSSSIPRLEDPGDLDYLTKLSQAASDLGLGGFAEELSKTYYENLQGHRSGGRSIAKESPNINNENLTDLESQIKVSEQRFTEAKALWIASLGSTDSKKIQMIRDLLSTVKEESKYSYEKEIILGLSYQKQDSLQLALEHVAKAQLLNPSLRLQSWLASLQEKSGDLTTALSLYLDLEKKINLLNKSKHPAPFPAASKVDKEEAEETLGVPMALEADQVILAEARIFEKKARWGEAALAYSRGIENGWGGNQLLYEYARSLIKSGSRSGKIKARETLEKLVNSDSTSKPGGEKESFWKKLARETLEDEKSKKSVMEDAKEGTR